MQFCLQGDNPRWTPAPPLGAVDRFGCCHRSLACRFDVMSPLVARCESLACITCKRPHQPYTKIIYLMKLFLHFSKRN